MPAPMEFIENCLKPVLALYSKTYLYANYWANVKNISFIYGLLYKMSEQFILHLQKSTEWSLIHF